MFRFKQFSVEDDQSSMKVGTDAVLLGAWADVNDAKNILDVGCGSGVVSIMLAQRCPDAHVVGVDIHESSVMQARHNADASPFASQLEFRLRAFQEFDAESKYSVIVSNPPYHQETLLPPDAARAAARHTETLPFEMLISKSYEYLKDGGLLQVIIPTQATSLFIRIAQDTGFFLSHRTDVVTRPGKLPKRTLLAFTKSKNSSREFVKDEIVLLAEDGSRSEQYAELCKDFYL